jgi:hypothetical protein
LFVAQLLVQAVVEVLLWAMVFLYSFKGIKFAGSRSMRALRITRTLQPFGDGIWVQVQFPGNLSLVEFLMCVKVMDA